ncbi:hypothetical protein [Algoriphagus resistens]|uniref:hypothetical protein n=1 Tax=Algoriphagus resistens TaxID=1750590 RepID=UPI00071699FE|nr:hypothetical protein [Algoriphagus resistens]
MTDPLTDSSIKKEFSNDEILYELNLILSSDLFSNSFVLSNFLSYIVKETLQGNAQAIKEYTIGVCALGKPEDFNPQVDALVRIHAGRLRRQLNEYYAGPGKDDSILIEVVKGTYVPVFRPKNHLNKAAEHLSQFQYKRSKLTLAILPFRNLCPENQFQFFVDGFGEELTRIFSAWPDIDVIAHHSTRKLYDNSTDPLHIGQNLGAHYLICGTVMRVSNDIRISVGLSESLSGRQIWSKTYFKKLEMDKVMDIQDQINDDIFAILSGNYGFIIRSAMNDSTSSQQLNLESFDAILWNYHAQMTHSVQACIYTRQMLEKALLKDPKNVMCSVVLGDLYLFCHTLGYPTVEEPVKKAFDLVSNAIKTDPLSQYAHIILGWVYVYMHQEKNAVTVFEKGLLLAPPSASINGTVGFGMACAGEYNRALELLSNSLTLNPYCPWWYYMSFFFIHFDRNEYQEALDYAYKIDASDDVFLKPLLKASAMGKLGLICEAQHEIEILNRHFQSILNDIPCKLSEFIIDKKMVENILDGADKAGLRLNLVK